MLQYNWEKLTSSEFDEAIEKSKEKGIECFVPKFEYCTDNAAMIGSAGYFSYLDNIGIADMSLAPKPNLSL